ncbi:MAG: GNAT family N-acetyltransferase [Candidatus Thermoplasmatota archaeon]
MAPGVTCRIAKPGDLDFLVKATLGNAWETEQLRLDETLVRRAVKKLLADPVKGRSFVAEADGKVVASLYVTYEWSDWHDAWYWWIQSLFVVPERRGQGVYSALYRFLHDEARKAGDVRSIRLYVEKNNENGLRAYRGHGMKEAPYVVFEQML